MNRPVPPSAPVPRDPAQKFWDPEMQTMDPERRRGIQDARVRELVERVLSTPVPLFQRKLEQAGITDARDVSGAADLDAIAVTTKQELRDSEAEHPPVGDYRFTPIRDCVRLGTSTGTTGIPTLRLWTRHDLWVEYESAARHWWRNGWRPGTIVTHAHPAYLYGGGMLLQGTYEYFGFLAMWVPPPETDDAAELGIRMWMRLRPDLPFSHYSVGRFWDVATQLGLDPREDVGLEQNFYEGAGDEAPLQSGGSECYAFVGSACHEDIGGHINEDWAVVEAVDPATGRAVPDGEWGSLTITTLDRDNGLLRYDLEEACRILREPCVCGETTMRALWGGRMSHVLSVDGQRFQVIEVERALRDLPVVCEPTLEYVVVRPEAVGGRLRVRVESDAADAAAGEAGDACVAAIRERLGVAAEVEIVPRGSLPRSGYKAIRLVDS